MADNITLNPGTLGDTVAADDVSGVKHQRVKMEFGADGSATDVSDANPLPIHIEEQHTNIESSTANLASGANYTTAWFDGQHQGLNYTLVAVADKDGTVEHEESIDGSTVAWSHETPYVSGEQYRVHHDSFARYSRFRFTNTAGTSQTSFKFSVIQAISPQTPVNAYAYEIDTTTTPLAGNASYTSKTFNTKTGGPALTFVCVSDQAGTLYLDESVNNVTWDSTASASYPGGGYVFNEMHTGHANFFRIRMVNGSSGQSYFRMQTIQRANGIPWMIKLDPNQAAVTQGSDAPWTVSGEKSNNASAVAGDNVPAITHICQASVPTYVDGRLVLPTTTTTGDTRVTLDGETVVLAAGSAAIGKLAANSGVDIGDVDVTTLPAVTIAASQTLATLTTCSTVTTVSTLTGGAVAHDAVDSGNPVKIGGRAESSLATATLVADADRIDFCGDLDGVQHVRPYCSGGDNIAERIADTGGTSTAFTNFGATTSTRNYITTIAIFNSSATDGYVDFRDGTAGTIIFTAPAPKGGGSVITFPVPLRQPTVNTALAYDVSGAITTVYISVVGFKSKL